METFKILRPGRRREEVIIVGKSLSLDQWLKYALSPKPEKVHPYNCFPTVEMRREYLASITHRTDVEVRAIIRNFVPRNGTYIKDSYVLRMIPSMLQDPQFAAVYPRIEYFRRLWRGDAWEGLSWVLDLLPFWPQKALAAIEAYFQAHCQFVTDEQHDGLLDAMAVVRARYMNTRHGAEALEQLDGRQFEKVVAALFRQIGFNVDMQPLTCDGGIDVIARKEKLGEIQETLIQCKRTSLVGVSVVRELHGVVSKRNAQKGAVATSGRFSAAARQFASGDRRIELLTGGDVAALLAEHFGTEWPSEIDRLAALPRETMIASLTTSTGSTLGSA